MSADEKLLRGGVLERDHVVGRRALCGLLEGERRFPAPPGLAEREAELGQELAPALRTAGAEIDGLPVETRGLVERERGGRVARTGKEIPTGLLVAADGQEMRGEHLGVCAARRLELHGEPQMMAREPLGGDVPHDRLADPIVIGLDVVHLARAPGAHEVPGSERRERGERIGRELRCTCRHALLDGPARHGDDLEEALRVGAEALEAAAQDLLERQRRRIVAVGSGGSRDVASELQNEERAPFRLDRDGGGTPQGIRLGAAEQRARQVAGLGLRQRENFEASHLLHAEVEQLRERVAPSRLLRAIGSEKEQRWRIRRPEDLGEEASAVEVAPLQIVDEQDEGARVDEPGEQLLQSGEGAPAALAVVRDVQRPLGHVGDRLDLTERGKETTELVDPARKESGGRGPRKPLQIIRESVDHAVESLEGD